MSQDFNDEYDMEMERVSRMIRENNYHDYDINPEGAGMQHIYKQISSDVIEDQATGLLWQRGGSEDMLSHDQTIDYIHELNQNSFATFNDWRLPALKEAMTLVEPQRNKYQLYVDLMFDQKPFCLWTTDTFISDGQTKTWFVNFVIGGCFDLSMSSSCCVRAVRGCFF